MTPPVLSDSEAIIVARERLRILAIGYYVRGGVVLVFSSFLLLYVIMFSAMSFIPESGWQPSPTPTPDALSDWPLSKHASKSSGQPPVILFRIFAGVMSAIMLLGWTFGALTAYAGRCIQKRKHKVLIYVMAGLNCMFIPYGTLLGVFTFIILGSSAGLGEFNAKPQ